MVDYQEHDKAHKRGDIDPFPEHIRQTQPQDWESIHVAFAGSCFQDTARGHSMTTISR